MLFELRRGDSWAAICVGRGCLLWNGLHQYYPTGAENPAGAKEAAKKSFVVGRDSQGLKPDGYFAALFGPTKVGP